MSRTVKLVAELTEEQLARLMPMLLEGFVKVVLEEVKPDAPQPATNETATAHSGRIKVTRRPAPRQEEGAAPPLRFSRRRAAAQAPEAILRDAVPDLLNVSEAASLAKVNHHTVRRWIRTGKLTAYNSGMRVRVDRADVIKFLTSPPPSN